MNRPLLTASMIVRDEERFLTECLKSVRQVVDEIVIVDTGSTDNSKAIARSFDAGLFDFVWCDDFSAARNEALRHSRGEWILYIDADERLQPVERQHIEDLLSDRSKVAFTVRFHPQKGFTPYREYRIFRNDPRILFDGVIHETIVPSLYAVGAEDNLDIGHSDVAIVHTGYDKGHDHKHGRNLALLRRQVKRDPKRIFCWWHLGFVFVGLGNDEEAEEAWECGIKVVRRKSSLDAVDSLPYVDLIRLRLNKGKDVTALTEEALTLFPGHYLLIWLNGKSLMSQKRFSEAISIFKYLVSIDGKSFDAGPFAYDARIFDVLSYEALAGCYYKLGRFEESAVYYGLAEQCEPGNMEYKIKRRFVSARAGSE
ncbi:MAG: glycosyltransferase [Thermodesulfobacteriota bacterium]|nr:glycosyltransferase [Thermodesulfobacteriota bacterium]